MHIIRHATLDDAKSLAFLAEQTFRDTFGPVNTAENMTLFCQSTYGESIQTAEIANPNMVTLLVDNQTELIGYAQLHWGEAPACVSAEQPGEIQRFYILSGWHGQGIAQRLMNACIAEMQQKGTDVVWLGVWENNPKAIAFYQKVGFVAVGEHVFPLGNDPQRDIVMARPVVAAAALS
ncbi:MAG: GNAT family N-acetyltransferase [Anaerolineae bacterium]|nr:GNAT family N-acetyltransferase [Anaerolineae bacterium]